jgi:hypothetical protein
MKRNGKQHIEPENSSGDAPASDRLTDPCSSESHQGADRNRHWIYAIMKIGDHTREVLGLTMSIVL